MMDVFSAVEHSVELIRPNDEPNVRFFFTFLIMRSRHQAVAYAAQAK